jgi:hypothetical protein
MKNYFELSVHEKINLKQHAINIHGKKWHTLKPDFLKKLNPLQIHSILN